MKKHVIQRLRDQGLKRVEAVDAFERVERAVASLIAEGRSVRLEGVGVLSRKTRRPGRRRDPRSGEFMHVGDYDAVALTSPRRF